MEADQVTNVLLQSGALKIAPDKPFRLASGLLSPFYIDCRRILSDAGGRRLIGDLMAAKISHEIGTENFDMIAGGVTAGVPYATMVAERLEKPMVYIRPEPKNHGTGSQIEGGDVSGKRIVLVEDLITRASSVEKFQKALGDANAVCRHLVVIVSRADQTAEDNLNRMALTLLALVDINGIVSALSQDETQTHAVTAIKEFLADPDGWSMKKTN